MNSVWKMETLAQIAFLQLFNYNVEKITEKNTYEKSFRELKGNGYRVGKMETFAGYIFSLGNYV